MPRFIAIVGAVLCCCLSTIVAAAQDAKDKDWMMRLGDAELISQLASADEIVATGALFEVFRRGESIVPSLYALKGRNSIFYGRCLNDWQTGEERRLPDEEPVGPSADRSWYVTVEVASLYLISAIHYDNLAFARNPYLIPRNGGDNGNTPSRIQQAWKSAERWLANFRKEGLSSLRRSQQAPLTKAKVYFYGTDPKRFRDKSDCRAWSQDPQSP